VKGQALTGLRRPVRSGDPWFDYIYVGDDKHVKAKGPVSLFCDCACCSTYALGYLHHLFKIGDSLFLRLATIHNMRFMVQLTERLRAGYYGQSCTTCGGGSGKP
jgi:queuine tRNA-ribosyltransferase